jgi:hypothetical protein
MACARRILVLGLGLALTGCQLNKVFELPVRMFTTPATTVTPLADGYFQVELDPSQLKALGGPGSSGLASHVEQEVAKSGLCKSGIRIVSEWWGNGYYGVKGQCKQSMR